MDADQWRLARWAACGLPGGRAGPWESTATAAVGRLGGVQAQEFDYTLWSLSQRTGQTREEILGEFDSGEFVRTHALRPTWHLIRRVDLARVHAATAARVHRSNAALYQQIGLDPPALANWRTWLTAALAPGPLTRAEIRAGLREGGRPMEERTLMGALIWAELEMIIVSGPIRAGSQTYRLCDPVPSPDRAESVTWLVRTFLHSHGPSTIADLAAWARLTVTEIRASLEEIGAQPTPAPHGECFFLEPGPHPAEWPSPCVALLNGFDEYISGLSAAGKAALDPMQLRLLRFGVPRRVIMIDGTVVGTWRRTVAGGIVRLDVMAARSLTEAEQEGVGAQAQAYGDFVRARVELRHESA